MTVSKRKFIIDLSREMALQKKNPDRINADDLSGVVQIARLIDFETKELYQKFITKTVAFLFKKRKRK